MTSADGIDVVMLTKNSNKPYFRRVLRAIKQEIPVHHFIVVDGDSTDGTIEVAKEFFGEKTKVIGTDAPLGGARYLGMRAVDTEWFAFIDSDVEILPGWFEAAKRYMQHFRIWGIEGSFWTGRRRSYVKSLLHPKKNFSWRLVLTRGIVEPYGACTSSVILRRGIANLVNPRFLYHLESGEDAYIAWKIIERGYIYIKVGEMLAVHNTTSSLELSKAFRRYIGYNGIFYAIPFNIYTIWYLFTMLKNLITRSLDEFLIRLVYLLGSPIQFLKVNSLKRYENYSINN
jgi:glycosyltransferase involved in cell wall biosynthesis